MEKRRDRLGHLEAILPADAVVFEQTLQRVVELGSKQGETTPWAITVSTCGQLLKHKEALLTFLEIQGIEPTNNAAE
jgi:hypothetical protein